MNDQPSKSSEGQPSHEAAKIVIPFDIDMSEVESSWLRLSVVLPRLMGSSQLKKPAKPSQQSRTSNFGQLESPSLWRESPDRLDISEKFQSEVQATLARMADLIRQLNDTVLLIYSNLSNRQ
jgi:hypothetical protein